MCGFVGCFGKADQKVDQAGISIIHRGPDEQKYVEGKDWSIKFNRNKIVCFLNEIEIEIKTNSKSFELIDADYFPEFGKKVKNKCLKINFDQNHIKTSFEIKT